MTTVNCPKQSLIPAGVCRWHHFHGGHKKESNSIITETNASISILLYVLAFVGSYHHNDTRVSLQVTLMTALIKPA